MCGIAGYIGEGSEGDLGRMIATLRHRGPDDTGTWRAHRVGFAQSRLAIIDLSPTGHQPMSSADGRYTIVFNGEIYNHKELRGELESTGATFMGTSDTEVILRLYARMGTACFARLDGMFAIAIYDHKRDSLVLVRDRVGEKPLYYVNHKNGLVFASEPKALFEHSQVKREPDPKGIIDFFTYDATIAPNSIFAGVKKLEPACMLVEENGAISFERYWHPPTAVVDRPIEDVIESLDRALEKSVRGQLIASDVPVGVFLSGGIDSSLVTMYAQEASSQPVKTFSIGFPSTTFDESSYARTVAKALGTEHHERVLAPEAVRDTLFEVISRLDEPLSDPTILPNYLLAGFAREHVTVALGGDGADELFAGYQTFAAEHAATLYALLPRAVRSRLIEPLIESLPVSHTYFSLDFKLKQFVRGFSGPSHRIHQHWIESWNHRERGLLLSSDIVREHLESAYHALDEEVERMGFETTYQKTMYRYLRSYLEGVILPKVDRSSMMHSLEVRAPFLDRNVVECAFALPKDHVTQGGKGKYVLRRLLERKLPREIVERKKHGFALPVGEWFLGPWKSLLLDVLSASHVAEVGVCDPKYVERIIEEHLESRKNHRKKLWSLLVFHLWYDAVIHRRS